MRPIRSACVLALLCCTAVTQTVVASATGAISSTTTTSINGTSSHSLPAGSPLPDGTRVATSMSSVAIRFLPYETPTLFAGYSTTETAREFAYTVMPPGASGSSSTSCSTLVTLTPSQPMQAALYLTWTTALRYGMGSTQLTVDIGNDGVVDWWPGPLQGVQATTFLVSLSGPLQVAVSSSLQANPIGGISDSTSTSRVDVGLGPVTPTTPRCRATTIGLSCGAALAMTDLGLGLLQFRPALNTPAPGDPVLLVLGLQGLSPGTPLPSGSSCLLLVAPVANHLALVGPAPISWTLDGRGLIGPFAFHAQVLHLSAGQLFASEALRVGCQ